MLRLLITQYSKQRTAVSW